MPQNDGLPLLEASRICNTDIIGRVQQVGGVCVLAGILMIMC